MPKIGEFSELNDPVFCIAQRQQRALGGGRSRREFFHNLSAMLGNFGDCEPVGDGISEMRIHCGPGYRVYFTRRGAVVYLLLVGGDKTTQKRDIKQAKKLLSELGQE